MSQIAMDFANLWVAENVQATVFGPSDGTHPEAAATLRRFLEDAEEEGIARKELEEDLGDLREFIASALEDATEEEFERLEDDE